jgi:hypothetical protein
LPIFFVGRKRSVAQRGGGVNAAGGWPALIVMFNVHRACLFIKIQSFLPAGILLAKEICR